MHTYTQDIHSINEYTAYIPMHSQTLSHVIYNYMTVRKLANLTTRAQSAQVHF